MARAAWPPWQIALVRKSIPCIELKMLKHGGTVSKTHSVCIPNKVDVVTTFPRDAAACGIVRCGGSMHSPVPTLTPRPRRCVGLLTCLNDMRG